MVDISFGEVEQLAVDRLELTLQTEVGRERNQSFQ